MRTAVSLVEAAEEVPMSYSGSWKMKEVRELRLEKEEDRSREFSSDAAWDFLWVR